jgi:hypothetical protein
MIMRRPPAKRKNGDHAESFEAAPALLPLIAAARATPPEHPDDAFTARVMARLPAYAPGARTPLQKALLRRRTLPLPPFARRPTTPGDCRFGFAAAAFYHLVLGMVLGAGLWSVASDVTLHRWIRMQPALSLAVAAALAAAAILLPRGQALLKRGGPLTAAVYTGLAALNGLLMVTALPAAAAVVSIGLLSACSLGLGAFLIELTGGFRRQYETGPKFEAR